MPEVKGSKSKTKTKKKNVDKPESKTKSKKSKSKTTNKQLSPSRRNEIWESMSDDLSETPSSPTEQPEGPLARGGANRFLERESVMYTNSNGTKEVAMILKIHLDDDLVPFYEIRLKDTGKEKQTDDGHLSPILNQRKHRGHIPDSNAFTLDNLSLRSHSYPEYPSCSVIEDFSDIFHHSSPKHRSLNISNRSSGTIAESRRSAQSSPAANMKRNSVQSPSQNKASGRNSGFVSGYVPSPRGSKNKSPTRPSPSSNKMSLALTPGRSSTNSSATRPPTSRRRHSTDIGSNPGRPNSTRSSTAASSPTRPPNPRRRHSTTEMGCKPGRPTSTRPSTATSLVRINRQSKSSGATSPNRRPGNRSSGGSTGRPRNTASMRPTSQMSGKRSTSLVPIKRPTDRRHSTPLWPTRKNNPKKATSSKRPGFLRSHTTPIEAPRSFNKTSHGGGHPLKLLKKRMSS